MKHLYRAIKAPQGLYRIQRKSWLWPFWMSTGMLCVGALAAGLLCSRLNGRG
jgi:hypothetical protein